MKQFRSENSGAPLQCDIRSSLTGTPPDLMLGFTLNNVKETDGGEWRLELTNEAGTGYADFRLKVEPATPGAEVRRDMASNQSGNLYMEIQDEAVRTVEDQRQPQNWNWSFIPKATIYRLIHFMRRRRQAAINASGGHKRTIARKKKVQNLRMQNLRMQNLQMQNLRMQNLQMQNLRMQNLRMQNLQMQNLRMQNLRMQNLQMHNFQMQNLQMENKHGGALLLGNPRRTSSVGRRTPKVYDFVKAVFTTGRRQTETLYYAKQT
nr:hypothetical protein BaRGS_011535 [Batillaria attramentaria]